jgi:hypothetical protein
MEFLVLHKDTKHLHPAVPLCECDWIHISLCGNYHIHNHEMLSVLLPKVYYNWNKDEKAPVVSKPELGSSIYSGKKFVIPVSLLLWQGNFTTYFVKSNFASKGFTTCLREISYLRQKENLLEE